MTRHARTRPLRSYLYAPGSRPQVMEKALQAGADAVILDLEDAVAAADKDDARAAVARLIAERATDAPCPVHVRVNRAAGALDDRDLEAVVVPGLSAVRVPKAESADELSELARRLGELEARRGMATGVVEVYPIVESAAGALNASALAGAPRVARLAFGATDFLADIAAPGETDGPATLHARGMLVLASRVAGVGAPIDSVYTALGDEVGIRRTAQAARALGFFGKSIIHPRQIAAVHDAFAPSAAELAWARRVMDSSGRDAGAANLDGEMIDPAVVARAAGVLALAGHPAGGDDER